MLLKLDLVSFDDDSSVPPAQCDPAPPRVAKRPEEIVYINRQTSAVELGLKAAELEVRKRVLARFAGRPELGVIGVITGDQFALADLAKGRPLHQQFNARFKKASGGKNIDDCGDLVEDISRVVKEVLSAVRLFVQLDHSDNVKNFITEEAYAEILSSFAVAQSHTAFKEALISPNLLSVGINLSQVLPQVSKPFEESLSHGCFGLQNVGVLFERIIRDHLTRMAIACQWDDAVNTRTDGKPFYQPEPGELPRNAVNFGRFEEKPVVACLGVVAGVPTLIAHQSSGSVQMFMEEDKNKKRVDRKVILGGLDFYEQVIATELEIPATKGYAAMNMPKPVVPELIMTSTSAEHVLQLGK